MSMSPVTRKPETCGCAGKVSKGQTKGEPHLPAPGVRTGQEGGGGWCPAGFGDRGLRGQQTGLLEAQLLTTAPLSPQGRSLSFKTFLVWVLVSIYQGKTGARHPPPGKRGRRAGCRLCGEATSSRWSSVSALKPDLV